MDHRGFVFSKRNALRQGAVWALMLSMTLLPLEAIPATNITLAQKPIYLCSTDDENSSSAVSINSATVQSGTTLYQSSFNRNDWSGDLKAFSIDASTVGFTTVDLTNSELWSAQYQLDNKAAASRSIYTSTAVGPQASIVSGLFADTNDSITTLTDPEINYLRGESVSGMRSRAHKLGDLVNSQPIYVGQPPFTYTTSGYSEFKAQSRTAAVYVGANDGMLHAFNASTGEEMFAYVPGTVLNSGGTPATLLPDLTKPNYGNPGAGGPNHHYFVDGTPTMGDIQVTSAGDAKLVGGTGTLAGTASDWRTVLVGGLGGGGKGYFALNVTKPENASTTSPVRWEINNTVVGFEHLGYSYARPLIVKTKGYGWVAIFTSGYNNDDGNGYLYVVDAWTGQPVKTIGPLLASAPTNEVGLGQPTATDPTGDGGVMVYAGDLLGNLWKFDLSDTNPARWDVAYKSGSNPAPIATVKDASGNLQPITTAPEIARITQSGSTYTVAFFGTGKYLEDTDKSSAAQQSFYAIKENAKLGILMPDASGNITNLVTRTISTAGDARTISGDSISWASKNGWFFNFPSSSPSERVIANPQIRGGRLIFVTFIPGSTCGGSSWLYDLDLTRGLATSNGDLDINNDGKVDNEDLVGGAPAAGKNLGNQMSSMPTILGAGDAASDTAKEVKLIAQSNLTVKTVFERGGGTSGGSRVTSWRELFEP